MITCNNCGKEIPQGTNFCPYCGASLKTADENPQVELTPANQATTEETQENKANAENKFLDFVKKYKKILCVLVIAIIVVIVAIGIISKSNCNYSDCNNTAVKGSDYCYNHKCNFCEDRKFIGSNYCYSHYLLYDDEASSISSNANLDLRFSNIDIEHNSSYTVVTGTVTNNGSRTYEFVKIKGSFESSAGSVIDTDWTYAVGSEGLAPGESTTFRMSVTKNYLITDCDISIIDYD